MTKKFSARDRVVILSHELWERQFASDASLIGRTIRLNRENYTVIGVILRASIRPDLSHSCGRPSK
jgi:MacB-like periplasmic core domain